jgi:hypothetical protein
VPVAEITNNWLCATFADTYRSPMMSTRLEQVLDLVQPHVVHVHNLLNLSFDPPAAARERGIPHCGHTAQFHAFSSSARPEDTRCG